MNWVSVLVLFFVICLFVGYEPIGISPSGMIALIAIFVGQFSFLGVPNCGVERACQLLSKAINSDPESLNMLASIKSHKPK